MCRIQTYRNVTRVLIWSTSIRYLSFYSLLVFYQDVCKINVCLDSRDGAVRSKVLWLRENGKVEELFFPVYLIQDKSLSPLQELDIFCGH